MSNTFWLMTFVISAQMLAMYIAYKIGASSPYHSKVKKQFQHSDQQAEAIIQAHITPPTDICDLMKKFMAQGFAHGYFLGNAAMARILCNLPPANILKELEEYKASIDKAFPHGQENNQ